MRRLAVFCAAACLAGHALGWWASVSPQCDPPVPFSVTGSVAAVSARRGAFGLAEPPRASAQPELPARLPPSDGSRIAELARCLGHDWRRCFRFVRDHVAYTPYFGFLRGAERTLLDMEGNDGDQSLLLAELLRACGCQEVKVLFEPLGADTGFVVPLHGHDGACPYNAASWFGADGAASDVQPILDEVWRRLSVMLCPVAYFYDASQLRHYVKTSRFWVSVAVGGETTYLDPAFKPCRRTPQRDFAADMGLTGLDGLSITNLDSVLDGYCSTLLAAWSNADAAAGCVGGCEVSAMDEDAPEFPGAILSGSPIDLSALPDAEKNAFRAEVSMRVGDGETSFFLDEIGSRMLWIAYGGDPSSPCASLRLGDATLAEETHPSDAFATMRIEVAYTNASTSADYALGRSVSNAFAVAVGFGSDDSAVRRIAAEAVAEAGAEGVDPSSPAFVARAARVAGQGWTSQCAMLRRLANGRAHGFSRTFYSLGLSGGGTAPYVDVKNTVSGSYAATNLFPAISFLYSALEHAAIEQITGTNVQAVSTARGLSVAAATGIPVRHVDAANFDLVLAELSGYSGSQVANLQSLVNAGWSLLLPVRPITLNEWSGFVFAAFRLVATGMSQAAMSIAGGLNGGYSTRPGYLTADGCANGSTGVVAVQLPAAEPQSADPVALPALAACDSATDLSLRGGSPLAWVRTYDSRSRNAPGALGRGWTHSFEASVRETSDSDAAFGGGSAAAAVPTAVALTVVEALMEQNQSLGDDEVGRRRLLAALVADWWTRRTTMCAAAVTLGARSLIFHRRADGSYVAPPGVTASLERTHDGGWRLAERNGNAYLFDASNRLARIADVSGNATVLSYGGDGRLMSVTNAFGAALFPSWDGGRVSSVSDGAGRLVSYAYDDAGFLTNVTDAAGGRCRMAYDPRFGALVSEFDPDGNETVRNLYNAFAQVTNQTTASGGTWHFGAAVSVEAWDEDPLGHNAVQTFDSGERVLSRTARDGGVSHFAYDGHGHVVTNVDASGCVRTAEYDGRDNLLRVVEGTGTLSRVTHFAYDASDRLVAVTNAAGGVTEFAYDSCGRVVRVLFADGTSQERSWTENGLLSSETRRDASGAAVLGVSYAYGANGLPASRTTTGVGLPPGGIAESFAWDAVGNLVSRTDGDGRTTAFSYDACGRLLSRTDALGGVTAYAWSSSGWLTNVTDAAGRQTAILRTPSGQVAAVVFPDGTVSTNAYDAADRLVLSVDPRGAFVSLVRDAEGRVVSRTTAAGTSSAAYSLLGLPVVATNAAGEATFFAYDAFGGLAAATNGLGHSWTAERDALANLTASHDPLGRMRTFAHDAMGRVVRETRPSGAVDGFAYDAAGRLVAYTNAAGQAHTIVRDALGRALSEIDAEGRALYQNAYDNCGNVTNIVRGGDTSGGPPSPAAVRLAYDTLDRLVSRRADGVGDSFSWSATGELISASNAVARETFAYDPCGRLASAETRIGTNAWATSWLRDAGGLVTNISYGTGMSVSREYDAEGRLVAVRDWMGHEWTFAYDGEGKPLGGTSPDGRAHTFSYDAAGRLSSWSVAGVAGRAISRDAAGRRTGDAVTAGTMPRPGRERRARNTFDRAGRLVESEEWKMENGECGGQASERTMYLHDGSGAVTNATIDGEGIFAAQYDALGRIASLGGSGFVPTAFAYDAVGNRVRAGGCIWIPDHDDPLKRPLLECDEDGAPVRAYVWGAGRLLGFVELGGSGFVPTALTVAHCDEQGSVIALSSAAGTLLHTAHFGPHGEDWGATGSNPTPFAWLGGLGVTRQLSTPSPQLPTPNSQLSTLYLSRHRLYAPTLRRFLSSDPLGLSGGLNLYAYCSGDPLTYVDPLGLSPWTRIGGFFQMIGGSIEASTGYGFAAFTATTGLGTALGVAVGLHGTDNALAGYYTMMNGTEQTTLTSQGLQSLGVSPDTARGIDAGIGMGATMGMEMAIRATETVVESTGKQTEVVQRWMSQAELDATMESGLLRGGRSGIHYVTDAANHDPVRAQLRLALDHTPEIRVKLEVPVDVFSKPSVVQPAYGMPGGGMERTASGIINVKILEVYK